LPVLRLQLVIIEDAFVCYQTRKSVLYLLCVISTIVPINFLVKSGESTFIVATCRIKHVTISTSKYQYTQNRHDTLKQNTACSFMTCYETCIHATCQHLTVCCCCNLKLHNDSDKSRAYKSVSAYRRMYISEPSEH
jgi:hypothetical protein